MPTPRLLLFALLLLPCLAACSATPNHDRAVEVGRNYRREVFDLSLSGRRKLGEDETYEIYGTIKPLTQRVRLGRTFRLEKEGVIVLVAILTEIDRDHLRIRGTYAGQDARGRDVSYELDQVIEMGIHCGVLYFRHPDTRMMAACLENDCLSITKVEEGAEDPVDPFPELPDLDPALATAIKNTCTAHWRLDRMDLATFRVRADRDEFTATCEGCPAEPGVRYRCTLRLDAAGQWINGGRNKVVAEAGTEP